MRDEADERDQVYQQLRREYLVEAPARLGELRKDLAAARAGEPDALASLKSSFHKLAGSGGSYGFPAISETSRSGELWLAEHAATTDADFALLGALVGRVAAAFDEAAREVGFPIAPQRPPPFGWRAHLVGGPSHLAARLAGALREAQYAVTTGPLDAKPADLPVSERPEIVLVVPAPGEDPRFALECWLGGPFEGYVAVALIADQDQANLLQEPFARLDLQVAPERAEAEVARWARSIARAAATPLSVLLVLPEAAERADAVGALEAAGIQVATATSAAEALAELRDDTPDLVVVDWGLPALEAPALVRELRRSIRWTLTPIIGLTSFDTDTEQERALGTGADELIMRPLTSGRLVAVVIRRGRRARRLEEVVRRDALTGFLTAAMAGDEMELILAHARRGGEQVSFVLFDLDHFRRINDQLGSRTGDVILTHVARAIRQRVRASDLVLRMGGEEFGVLLRECGPAQAKVISNQIRSALLITPALVEGVALPVRLSAGIAAYPDHALAAREIMLAAERALREAKETGRDKVVLARPL